jgi:CheY-like chemotaxis protein
MTTIALIDDDVIMRQLLKKLLELDGFKAIVIEANDIDGILKELFQEIPDAILLDVILKGKKGTELNGMEVTKVIRKTSDLNHIKILMASGMDCKYECISAGADGFLLKPFMPDELVLWMKENRANP